MTDEPKFAPEDMAILKAAATGEGAVKVTRDLMNIIGENLRERMADIDARYPELVKACDYETRLAVTAWVFEHLVAHAQGAGSFRYLIYNRLGFGPDAYVPLYNAGGMTISNELDLAQEPKED